MKWTIASTLSLLLISAGMFLLAKSKKEELGKIFRFTSYFIIVWGIIGFGASIMQAAHFLCFASSQCDMKSCGPSDCNMKECTPGMHMNMDCRSMKGGKGMHFEKRIIINGEESEGKDCCADQGEPCEHHAIDRTEDGAHEHKHVEKKIEIDTIIKR